MRNFWLGFFTAFSILGLVALIICVGCFPNLFWIFFNRYHEFQWSSLVILTILLSLITLIVNTSSSASLNHQRMIAENIAKSRIEWLNVTRKYVSDYISSVNKAYFLATHKNSRSELNQLLADVENKYYLVLLSFNPNEKITNSLNDYQQIAYGKVSASEKAEINMNLGKEVQAYFKDEWEKAKLEIKTGEIASSGTKHS